MNTRDIWFDSLCEARNSLKELYYTSEIYDKLENLSKLAIETIQSGNKIMICGNGGSHADAMHFAEELTGRFRNDRKPLSAIALCTNPTHITCVSNDYGFDDIFSREVQAIGKEGDLLILLSTSGNSSNLLYAASVAKGNNINTFALLGKDGGELTKWVDNYLIVPGQNSDRIQELHMVLLHILVETIESNLTNS